MARAPEENSDWKARLRDCHQGLRTDIIVNHILAALHPLLTPIQYSCLRDETKKGNALAVDELVDILLTKEESTFNSFCLLLDDPSIGYSGVARKLRGTSARVSNLPQQIQSPNIEELSSKFAMLADELDGAVHQLSKEHLQKLKINVSQKLNAKNPTGLVLLAETADELMNALNRYWGFLNFEFAQLVVDFLGLQTLQKQMISYEEAVDKKAELILRQCKQRVVQLEPPPKCVPMLITVNVDPHSYCLHNIRQMKYFLVNRLGLSIAIFSGWTHGVIELLFYIAEGDVPLLHELDLNLHLKHLQELQVTKVEADSFCFHVPDTSEDTPSADEEVTKAHEMKDTAEAIGAGKALDKAQYNCITGWVSKLRSDCPQLTLLVIGEAGVGKSTLINNLLGEEVAEEGHKVVSTTSAVNCYEGMIEGVSVKIYDTAGLGDIRLVDDEEYLQEIKKLDLENIHLVIYCMKMTETRIRRSITHTFQQYTAIGVDWRKTTIALTFADDLKPPPKLKKGSNKTTFFEKKLAEWRANIPKVLAAEVHLEEADVARIKINPTTGANYKMLPNGEEWYIPFWLDVLDALSPAARIRFIDIHRDNIKYPEEESRKVPELENLALPPLPEPTDSSEVQYSDKGSTDVCKYPDNFTFPPSPKPEESDPPLYKTAKEHKYTVHTPQPVAAQAVASESPSVAVSDTLTVNQEPITTSHDQLQRPVSVSLSISVHSIASVESSSDSSADRVRNPVIQLEGERRQRLENSLGDAVLGSNGRMAFGGLVACVVGAIVIAIVKAFR